MRQLICKVWRRQPSHAAAAHLPPEVEPGDQAGRADWHTAGTAKANANEVARNNYYLVANIKTKGEIDVEVVTLHEKKRGCGWRHTGKDGVGIYLMGELLSPGVCELLPWSLDKCPCCGGGIKFARAWTSITPSTLFVNRPCAEKLDGEKLERLRRLFPNRPIPWANHDHEHCPMCNPPPGIHGLVWVGHTHYTAASFTTEAQAQGVSKRLPSVPRDLEIGKTVVYVAHIKACGDFRTGDMTPGVFMAFKPTHIDIVVDGEDDVPDRAVHLRNRHEGCAQLVKVVPE